MVNYENSKIYKIVDNTNGNIYIGSTTEPTLARRLQKHKASYNQYIQGKQNFITSFNIIKNGDYDIILLEKCENIKSKDELHARERYFIENNVCVNKNKPHRTNKEYKQDNKEQITEKAKEYYKTKGKELYELNKDKIKEYYELNKDKRKELYELNKDKINERIRELYILKKDKKNERRRELRKNKKLELEKNKNI